MSDTNNNEFSPCLQVVLFVAFCLFLCGAGAFFLGIRVTVNPPNKPTPVFAPTATPDPYHVILLEQAKASARVQVITAETDNEIKLRWNIHYMRRWWAGLVVAAGIFFTGLGLFVFFWWYRHERE